MAGFQPKIMVMDGLDQDGPDPTAIGAQSIGEYLIAHQRRAGCWKLIPFQALADALGKRLFRMGDAVHAIAPAKDLHPIVMAVGYHAQRNIGRKHFSEPGIHFLRCFTGGIGYDGIVEIQHQQFDPPLLQKFG